MKRLMKVLAVLALCCVLLTISAFAADFTHCADALHELGLFQGTEKGYELDRKPTRAEAAVMLVRLLGAEDAAKELPYSAPFTDVEDWAKPYVQYLYENGLTNGKTDVLFGGKDICTADQYTVFLLRALGYSDQENADFTNETASEFGGKLGLIDGYNCSSWYFLRDHVAAMSYTALSIAPKSGEVDLLTKLIRDGAVEDAKGHDVFFAKYRAHKSAISSLDTEQNYAFDMVMESTVTGDSPAYAKMKMSYVCENTPEDPMQSKFSIKTEMESVASGMRIELVEPFWMYYHNGWLYINGLGQKYKAEASFQDAIETDPLETNAFSSEFALTVSTIDRIEVSNPSKNTTVSTVHYLASPFSYVDETTSFTKTEKVILKSGALYSVTAEEHKSKTTDGKTATEHDKTEIKNIRTGKYVKVSLPKDLDRYEAVYSLWQ